MFLEGHDNDAPTLVARATQLGFAYQVQEWILTMRADYPMITHFKLFDGEPPISPDSPLGARDHSARQLAAWRVVAGEALPCPIGEEGPQKA